MSHRNPPSANAQLVHVQKEFIRFAPELRGYLYALLADRSLVDDVLQSVFVELSEHYQRYDTDRDMLPWLRGIARNLALKAVREEGRAPRALSPDVIKQLHQSVPTLDTDLDQLQMLAECVEQLAPQPRLAIRLRYNEGLRPTEIAERLSVMVASVHVMLSKARVRLRECVQRKQLAKERTNG